MSYYKSSVYPRIQIFVLFYVAYVAPHSRRFFVSEKIEKIFLRKLLN